MYDFDSRRDWLKDKKPPCHEGSVLTFTTKDLDIYGAGRSRYPVFEKKDVIIDLADNYGKLIECNGAFKNLERYNTRKFVKISWPDGGIPRIHPTFWVEFAETIQARKGPMSLVFICDGGHGRTGTALCIIGCLLNLIPEDACPVEYVRKVYCTQVVETQSQIDYIARVTGREVTSIARPYIIPSKVYSAG
jgi:protein-tyrosine phosphatase